LKRRRGEKIVRERRLPPPINTHTLLSTFRVQEAGTKLIAAHVSLIGTMLTIITIAPQLVTLMTGGLWG
jgi:hypothetical protein